MAPDVEDVHRGRAHEPGHEAVRRLAPDLVGRTELLELAVPKHGDPLPERQRLDLVVRDVEHRRPDARVQLLQLGARPGAKLRIQVRERLVEEEDVGLADERPRERDPLPLAARELGRTPLEQLLAPGELRGASNALAHLGSAHVADDEPEADVLAPRSGAGRGHSSGRPSRRCGFPARAR